jgi:type VI protein secretion system component Hcp
MAKKKKVATKRTKVEALPKSKRELTGKDMRNVKGGDVNMKPFTITKNLDTTSTKIYE